MVGEGGFDGGFFVAVVVGEAAFVGDAVEIGEEAIEVFLGDGIVFVIMAAGAAHSEAHPNDGSGLGAVGDVFDAVFFRDDAAFAVGAVVAVEAGRDDLGAGGIGQEIAGELFDGELIVGHVFVESVDDPVAPAPHFAGAVGLIAVGIAKAGGFHPTEGHAFAVAGRLQEAVHDFFVGVGR